jgi:hypothetical protein
MTLKELVKIFNTAAWAKRSARFDTADEEAGTRAVVEALRDEGRLRDTDRLLQEILASDGVERVDPAEPCALGAAYPSAAAPVCEWTPVWKDKEYRSCVAEGTYSRGAWEEGERCPNCDRPIRFKSEAAR